MRGRLAGFFIALMLLLPAHAQAAGNVPVVVKIRTIENLSVITSLLGGNVLDSIPETNTYLLNVPSLPTLTPFLRLLGVESIELDRGLTLSTNAPLGLSVPWNTATDWYKNQPSLQLIRAGQTLAHSTGSGVIIADINSRVDYGHPALIGHLTAGHDFVAESSGDQTVLDDDQSTGGFLDDDQSTGGFLDDDQSTGGFLDGNGISLLEPIIGSGNSAPAHGTLCAGILAVMAPNATIMPVRAFDDNGHSDVFRLAKAIRYARKNGAQVINMSFGTTTDHPVIREAIEYALAGNVVLVASAGNNNTSTPQYPAAYPGVISVAATDLFDQKTSFSNYGSHVFVDAPGNHIISALPDGKYGIANGTSFSSPMVAAMAALIRSLHFSGTSTTIEQSTVPIDSHNPGYTGQLGHGRIDILLAVEP